MYNGEKACVSLCMSVCMCVWDLVWSKRFYVYECVDYGCLDVWFGVSVFVCMSVYMSG